MALFENIINVLGYVNMAAWALAAGASYKFSKIFEANNRSWKLIMAGSIFVLARQLIKLLPAYSTSEAVYVSRYLLGAVGALLLFIGFINLYYEMRK